MHAETEIDVPLGWTQWPSAASGLSPGALKYESLCNAVVLDQSRGTQASLWTEHGDSVAVMAGVCCSSLLIVNLLCILPHRPFGWLVAAPMPKFSMVSVDANCTSARAFASTAPHLLNRRPHNKPASPVWRGRCGDALANGQSSGCGCASYHCGRALCALVFGSVS